MEISSGEPLEIEPQAVFVAAGADRLGQQRAVFGQLPMLYKVMSRDTDGRLLVIEQENVTKGGPPRHVHSEQDEWFYVVAGEYVVEVGDHRYQLGPGDCVLAPRQVPHLWAHVGETTPGRLLITFQPAGEMEAFFSEAVKMQGTTPGNEMGKLFQAHGMEIVGPPLLISDVFGTREGN